MNHKKSSTIRFLTFAILFTWMNFAVAKPIPVKPTPPPNCSFGKVCTATWSTRCKDPRICPQCVAMNQLIQNCAPPEGCCILDQSDETTSIPIAKDFFDHCDTRGNELSYTIAYTITRNVTYGLCKDSKK